MTTRKRLTTTVLAAITLAVVANSASAADYRHLDRLALRITKNTETLFREIRVHYRHTSEYGHLISDVRELRRHALHIHEVAHHRGSLSHLASDVREMDRLFHHLEGVIERLEHRSFHNRHHSYHSGHVHGNTTHVATLMHAIEDDLHHLGEDVAPAPRTTNYRRRGGPIAVPAPYAVPSRTLRVPVPARPVRVFPAPSRYGSHGTSAIPTPFGRILIHH